MAQFNTIQFTISEKAVIADRRMPYVLYTQNKVIAESLGGTVDTVSIGAKMCMRATFKKVADAKAFIKQAVCEITAEEYEASRKPKAGKGKKEAKPKTESKKKSARKGKGNAPTKAETEEVKKAEEITPSAQKALDRMQISVLNRAASAYSIANGGVATTYSALGKSAEELAAYIPAAKAGLLKSHKWAKAQKTYGLTEDMLG